MKIRNKINLSFLGGFAIVLLLVSLVIGVYTNQAVKDEVFSKLEVAAHLRADHIETFFDQMEGRMSDFASDGKIKECLRDANDSNSDGCTIDELVGHLISNKLPTIEDLTEVFIIDLDGTIIASSEETHIGLNKKEDPYFIYAQEESFAKELYYSETTNRKEFAVSAPINVDGELEGVIVGRLGTDKLFYILEEEIGLGENGETYLLNSENYFISPSQFWGDDVILTTQVDTLNSRNCNDMREHAEHGHVDVEISHTGHKAVNSFLSYQGAQVIGTHVYMPEADWCLLAEIDKEIALAPVRALIINLTFISIAALILSFLISMLLARTLCRPIECLKKHIQIVEKGNLNHNTTINSKDEIGELSNSFDKMTKSIKKSWAAVDLKVQSQTKDLEIAKNKAFEDRDKINAILHGIDDGVFVVDENFKITMFNQIAVNVSGFKEDEIIGKKCDELLRFVKENNEKSNDDFIETAIKTGETQKMTNHTVLIRKDGARIAVTNSASPLKDENGKVVGCVVVFRDVTKEREVDRMKSEFVSMTSHQLLTPITAIKWYSEMLLRNEVGKVSKAQSEYLKNIYSSNQRMIELINALLNVSRIESGSLAISPTPTNVHRIADNILGELGAGIQENKLKIAKHYDEDLPIIDLDQNLIRIVFQNLLSNAVKYSFKEETIDVTIKKQNLYILVEISNTGYGIPQSQQSKMFKKLFRGDNIIKQEVEGSGLGLYITKAVVELTGGKIWFKSEENGRTTFSFTIPPEGMENKRGTKGLISHSDDA